MKLARGRLHRRRDFTEESPLLFLRQFPDALPTPEPRLDVDRVPGQVPRVECLRRASLEVSLLTFEAAEPIDGAEVYRADRHPVPEYENEIGVNADESRPGALAEIVQNLLLK